MFVCKYFYIFYINLNITIIIVNIRFIHLTIKMLKFMLNAKFGKKKSKNRSRRFTDGKCVNRRIVRDTRELLNRVFPKSSDLIISFLMN